MKETLAGRLGERWTVVPGCSLVDGALLLELGKPVGAQTGGEASAPAVSTLG